MRLTEFIELNREKIIEEWIKFASTLVPWATGMSDKVLRDHAEELLTAVVRDMKASQSDAQQSAKSQGKAAEGSALAIIGHKHASQRLDTGFNLDQLVSEYRALRATVLRLWAAERGDKQNEMTRFNEAIDESLTEATAKYSEKLEHTREQFLAILGHDLRNPLSAIALGAAQMQKSAGSDDKQIRVAARVLNSANRMARMVGDLLDFTRTRLGAGIPVTRTQMDLGPMCQQVIAELETIHPTCRLEFVSKGNLQGDWDSDRLMQVVSNLVANAVQYGGEKGPVNVVAEDHGEEVVISVCNEGPPIPENALKKIFEPMVRAPSESESESRNKTGMGLGLYIARAIVHAHGGTISVTSTKAQGTTFTLKIPRSAPAKEAS